MAGPRTVISRTCRLASAVGAVERCTESGCPFWEPGGAALEGRCAFERVALDQRPELARWLVELRPRLAGGANDAEGRAARAVYDQFLRDCSDD